MAAVDIEPISFTRTATTDSATDVMQVLYDFFNTDATLWTVDVEDASPTNGFAVTPTDVGLTFQVNFRPNAGNIEVLVDADGTITDPTNPTASAGDHPGEQTFVIQTGDTRFDFHEHADAFWIEQIDGGATPFTEQILHAGMVITPFLSTDPAAGLTGIGLGLGEGDISSGSNDLFTSSATTKSYCRTATGTWEGAQVGNANPGGGEDAVGGRIQPLPLVCQLNSGRKIGLFKYVFKWDDPQAPQTIIRNTADSKEFVAFYNAASAAADNLHPIEFGFAVAT